MPASTQKSGMSVFHFTSVPGALGQGGCYLCSYFAQPYSAASQGDEKKTLPQAESSAAGRSLAQRVMQKSETPAKAWDEVFAGEAPGSEQLADAILILHAKQQYNLAVEGLLSAIRNGHAAPWMYDVLALEMKLAKRPTREIARVLESRIDFAASNVSQLLLTAALLSRFEAWDEAIAVCREATQLAPQLEEAWLLARSVADKSGNVEAQVWTRCGILTHVWGADYSTAHQEAAKVLGETAVKLERKGQSQLAEDIRRRMQVATAVDLQIIVKWIGPADLDLIITEPDGEQCSYKRRLTTSLGRLIREEGVGDEKITTSRHAEHYLCHTALSGEYRIAVRFVLGNVAAGTAVLEIIQHAGTPHETRATRTLKLTKEDVTTTTMLKNGRRSVESSAREQRSPSRKEKD